MKSLAKAVRLSLWRWKVTLPLSLISVGVISVLVVLHLRPHMPRMALPAGLAPGSDIFLGADLGDLKAKYNIQESSVEGVWQGSELPHVPLPRGSFQFDHGRLKAVELTRWMNDSSSADTLARQVLWECNKAYGVPRALAELSIPDQRVLFPEIVWKPAQGVVATVTADPRAFAPAGMHGYFYISFRLEQTDSIPPSSGRLSVSRLGLQSIFEQ